MANPIIDRARLHFRADERRAIEVPEWGEGGQPLMLYAAPCTLADKRVLHNRYKDGGLQEMYVHARVMKAQHEDGKPAFDLADKRALMTSVDPAVVERVAEAILASASVEDAEKN